ncbi:hypothetical protein D3C72_1765510 [compost metagenome]
MRLPVVGRQRPVLLHGDIRRHMKLVGLRPVIRLSVLVLDIDEVELPRTHPLDADIGVGIDKAAPVGRIGVRIGKTVRCRLDQFGMTGKSPVGALEEWRRCCIIFGLHPGVRLLNARIKRFFRRRIGRKRFALLDAEGS